MYSNPNGIALVAISTFIYLFISLFVLLVPSGTLAAIVESYMELAVYNIHGMLHTKVRQVTKCV